MWLRWFAFPVLALAGLAVLGLALAGFVILLAYPNLPSIEALTEYQPKIPLRVYTADGVLIGEFGEERRSVVRMEEVPDLMKQAILAAEDERFYQHTGVDYHGVLRAAYSNLVTGGKTQGASTITMQVARNFFLSREKTLTRKLYEALLAFKIENSLSKDQILEIYINQIYLGQKAYGFGAAAQVYFGKTLSQLNSAEIAMLAGLPKAPSSFNPVINPKRAKQRQLYVLRRMHELALLDTERYEEAQTLPISVKRETVNEYEIHAEFVAEMVRQLLYERYPEDVYSRGFRVYTTIRRSDQEAAYAALRQGLLEYDRRHGYRGPEGFVDLKYAQEEDYEETLQDHPDSDDILAALVLEATPKRVTAYRRGGETVTVSGEGLKFAERMLDSRTPPTRRIRRGALIRIQKDDHGDWQIVQLPEAEGAFISVNPQDGAVRSLVGGFDFNRSQYNHVTQAWRQPGSGFKPFIYSSALEKGFTPATVINDAPVVVDAALTGGQVWEPKNYDGRYEGPISMRMALADGPFVSAVVVFRFPYLPTGEGCVDHHRSVVDDGGWRETLFQSGGVDEGLEARTRLAPGLGDVVVLASIEVETADQGANGAIVRVGGDKGALGLRKLDDLPVVGFVFLDADHGSGPDSAGRRRAGIEHSLGELEPLSRYGDGFASAAVRPHALGRRFQHERREDVVAVGIVLQHLLVILLLRILQIDEALRAAVAVAPVVFEQSLAKGGVGRF